MSLLIVSVRVKVHIDCTSSEKLALGVYFKTSAIVTVLVPAGLVEIPE